MNQLKKISFKDFVKCYEGDLSPINNDSERWSEIWAEFIEYDISGTFQKELKVSVSFLKLNIEYNTLCAIHSVYINGTKEQKEQARKEMQLFGTRPDSIDRKLKRLLFNINKKKPKKQEQKDGKKIDWYAYKGEITRFYKFSIDNTISMYEFLDHFKNYIKDKETNNG